MDNIEEIVKKLQKDVELLKQRRVLQSDIAPGVVKMRHMGEANQYVQYGLEADLPSGFSITNSTIIYYATDTKKLWVWNPETSDYDYAQFI